MAPPGQNTTMHFDCVPKSSGTMSIIVTFLALPFHIFMVKILWRDIQLPTPRDRIMLSLSISDMLQILAIFFTAAVMQSFELTTESATCIILRDIALLSLQIIVTFIACAIMKSFSLRWQCTENEEKAMLEIKNPINSTRLEK